MSRATAVYVVMAVCLVAGMWVVLGFGSTLRAPPDLSGTWELAGDVSLAGLPPLGRGLRVEQSGRFVRFDFAAGPVIDLKIAELREAPGGGRGAVVVLVGGPWARVEAEGDPTTDALRLRFTGPSGEAETGAVRTARTYATRKKDAPR